MERLTNKQWKEIEKHCYAKGLYLSNQFTEEQTDEMIKRLAELEDKLESGQLVDTTPYIVEIKSEIPFKYKVIKPTIHRRNVEMCDSKESAEACLKKLEVKYANKTRKQESLSRELETDSFRNLKACKQSV